MAHEGKRHGFAGSGNSEIYTTSVSKVVAQNNDNLKKLIASERSNFSDQGNSTYLDANNVTRDAIGREINVGPGYDLHSGVTPADKSINNVQSDSTLNASAQRVIIADEKVHEAAIIGEKIKAEWRNQVKETFGSISDDVEKTAASEVFMSNYNDEQVFQPNLNEALNNEILGTTTKDLETTVHNLGVGSGRGLVVEEAGERAAYLNALEVERTRIAQTSATADGPFDKSLPPGGRDLTHSDAYLENEKAATAALKNDANELMIAKHNVTHGTNYLKPIPVDVSAINSGTAYRSMHTDMDELKASERFADGGSESYYFETQDEDGNDISVLIENEVEEKLYEVDAENLFLQNSKDGLIASEREGIGFTVDEITSRAIAEAKAKGLEERETMSAEEIENISESIADKSKRLIQEEAERGFRGDSIVEGPGERAAYIQNELEKEKGRNPKNRFDSIREKQKLEQEKKVQEEKAKIQRESHDKYQNDRIDSIAAASDEAANKSRQALSEQMQENQQRTLGNDSAAANPPVDKSSIADKYAGLGGMRQSIIDSKDPFRFTTLTYPTEVTTSPEYGHYMLFYVNVQNKTKYKYHGYNDDGNYATIGDVIETQTYSFKEGPRNSETTVVSTAPTDREYKTNYHSNTGASAAGLADDISYLRGGVQAGRPGNLLQSNQVNLMRQRQPTEGIASRLDLTSRITDSVALYLPSNVESNVSASYTGFDMGLLGFLALGGADIIKQVKDRDFEGAAENFLGTGERMLTEMIKKAGIAAVDAAFGGGGGTEQVFNKVFGQTTNPFIEVAFNNMSLRDFSYTFNFRPRSADETAEVKAIIQLFRFHMAPELKGTNHRYMTLPSTFDIHYMYQSDPETARENTFYNKIATCVLERCDVNYTPTGVKSFDDGAPTEITMGLTFKETELLTKNKINQGF